MFGFDFNVLDWAALIIAVLVTIYVAAAKNPHDRGTEEWKALRVCRVGLALLVWSFGFGLIGFGLAIAAFVLGIIGIVKGRGLYGAMLIVGSIILPLISVANTIWSFSRFLTERPGP